MNGSLVYLWRIPGSADASHFASSPTKKNGFRSLPELTLFDPSLLTEVKPTKRPLEQTELDGVVRNVDGTMPLVLVMARSTPSQLRSIGWAIAELSEETGLVTLHGHEFIWESEPVAAAEISNVETFDSGVPIDLPIELRKREGTDTDG